MSRQVRSVSTETCAIAKVGRHIPAATSKIYRAFIEYSNLKLPSTARVAYIKLQVHPLIGKRKCKKETPFVCTIAEALGIKNQHRVLLRIVVSRSICGELKARLSENVTASIAFDARPKPNGGRFRELFMGEAVVLVPATTAVLPGFGLWPSAHPFGRRGPPAFR
jgi:hypothetical protein